MCGIVGAVATRNIVPILVQGLQRLEYRGYDSCGIAVNTAGVAPPPVRLRRVRGIHAYRPAEKDGQWLTMSQAAEQLGVTSRRGIPVAVFLDRDGQLIGVTNDGELEPARAYTSRQILAFIQEVAANRQIVRP